MMFRPVRREMRCKALGSRPIPILVGSTTVSPPSARYFINSSIAKSASNNWQLSRLIKGLCCNSPRFSIFTGISAICRSLQQQGGTHLPEASSRICSCISVTPSFSTASGPSTVMAKPLSGPNGKGSACLNNEPLKPSLEVMALSLCTSNRVENAGVQPDSQQNDQAGGDLGIERRHVGQN